MSSIEQMNTLIESLSFAEKLSLNERLAGIIRKEGGGAAGGKKRGPKAKIGADGEPKPKRKAALGTLAWMAYVKHIKDTQPEALAGHTKEAEKLAIIKGIRAEDGEGYNTFVAEWKEEHKDDSASVVSASDAEGDDDAASQVSAPASVAKPLTALEKIAALKAAKAASASASSPAAKPVVKATEVKVTPTKATKPAATTAPKKEVKSVKTAKAVEKVEEPTMATLEIDGVEYWHDPSTNYLWEKTGKSTVDTGEGVGYYQPDNAEEPIRVAEFGEDA